MLCLFSLIYYAVPPSSIQILDESGNLILNATTLGPLRENHRFTSICEIRGTRPAPMVGWYRAGKRLQGNLQFKGIFYYVSIIFQLYIERLFEHMQVLAGKHIINQKLFYYCLGKQEIIGLKPRTTKHVLLYLCIQCRKVHRFNLVLFFLQLKINNI